MLGGPSYFVDASGAVHAFVSGLEDEHFEVRMGALDSVCEIALQNETFRNKGMFYIVGLHDSLSFYFFRKMSFMSVQCFWRGPPPPSL